MGDDGILHDFQHNPFREAVDRLIKAGYLKETEFCGMKVVCWPGIPDDEVHMVEPNGKRHVIKT